MNDCVRNTYALMAIVEIVYQNSPVTAKTISKLHSIPYELVAEVILHIKKFGLVKSIRGLRGGYIFNCNPDIITAADVINALESSNTRSKPQYCSKGRGFFSIEEKELLDNSDCNKCFTESMWAKISDSDISALNLISITDLVNDYRKVKELKEVLQ